MLGSSPSAWALTPCPRDLACFPQSHVIRLPGVSLPPPQAYPLSCCPAFSLPARRTLLTGRHHPQHLQPRRKPSRDPSQRGHLPLDTASRSSSARYQLGAPSLPGFSSFLATSGSPRDPLIGWVVWAAALRCRRGGSRVAQLEGLPCSQQLF